MNNKLLTAETLMSQGGLLPLDIAVAFMTEGYDMKSIDDYGFDVEFEITNELLENL